MCQQLFADDTSKQSLRLDAVNTPLTADLSLSLDVIYHLVEDSVYDGCA